MGFEPAVDAVAVRRETQPVHVGVGRQQQPALAAYCHTAAGASGRLCRAVHHSQLLRLWTEKADAPAAGHACVIVELAARPGSADEPVWPADRAGDLVERVRKAGRPGVVAE